MTDKVDLPGGEWARLRDPEDVIESDAQPLRLIQAKIASSALAEYFEQRAKLADLPPEELNSRLRPFMRTAVDDGSWGFNDENAYQAIVTFVAEWSLTCDGQPLPISVPSVRGLPAKFVRPLRAKCEPLISTVFDSPSLEDLSDESTPTPAGDGTPAI